MIDELCAEQLELVPLIRNAKMRGNRALVARYVACWCILDKMIKGVV